MLTRWLDTKRTRNGHRAAVGDDGGEWDCITCLWSTDSFVSFSHVMAFHSEAMKFLNQIDCNGEDCYCEKQTDNASYIEMKFWTKESSHFIAILRTLKAIFSGGSRHHRVTSVKHVCRNITKAKMRLKVGGTSTIALSAKLAFDAYLELNDLRVHGNENMHRNENAERIGMDTACGVLDDGMSGNSGNSGNHKRGGIETTQLHCAASCMDTSSMENGEKQSLLADQNKCEMDSKQHGGQSGPLTNFCIRFAQRLVTPDSSQTSCLLL